MRIARLVGLSQDGRSLLVVTPDGEQLALVVDERLHASLRGDRPRLGQLEIEMDNALGPRDIQARIRAGQSLEDVARVAGMPPDRVERFAAPVIAEREHVARVAAASSVRRRGETSGHRVLRVAVGERLAKRRVEAEAVDWDAYRLEDGRWSVSASYSSGESARQAVFLFDLQGRFSVAGNDEARWLVGEQSPLKGPQPGRRRSVPAEGDVTDGVDGEPTLDLTDELALVRVVQAADAPPAGPSREEARPTLAPVPQAAEAAEGSGGDTGTDTGTHPSRDTAPGRESEPQPAGEPVVTGLNGRLEGQGTASPLDTLAGMPASGDDRRADRGPSDASAVPDTDNAGWDSGPVAEFPVEPGAEPADDRAPAVRDERDPNAAPVLDGPVAQPAAEGDRPAEPEPTPEPVEPVPASPPRAAGKRRRAAVPSWDEIMFGGPSRSS